MSISSPCIKHFVFYGSAEEWGGGDYIDELSAVSNTVFVSGREDWVSQKLAKAQAHGMTAIIVVESVLFQSGSVRLDPNYVTNFERFHAAIAQYDQIIAGYYVYDEPYLNNSRAVDLLRLSDDEVYNSLSEAIRVINTTAPGKATAIVFALSDLTPTLKIPANLSWLGFDCYVTTGCPDERIVQNAWEFLHQLKAPEQKIVAVVDSFQPVPVDQPGHPRDVPISSEQQDTIIGRLQLWESLISASDQVVAVAPYVYPTQDQFNQDQNRWEVWAGSQTMPAVRDWLQAYYSRASPQAKIRWLHEPDLSGCGVHMVEGEVVTFGAQLDGDWASAAAMHQWKVAGAELNGPTNQKTLQVHLPEPATPVTITLTVTNSQGCRASDQRTFQPLTKTATHLLYRTCQLIQDFTRINHLANPLGPDAPGELRQVALSLLRDTSQLLAAKDPGINSSHVTKAQELATSILQETEEIPVRSDAASMSDQDASHLRRLATRLNTVADHLQSSYETGLE